MRFGLATTLALLFAFIAVPSAWGAVRYAEVSPGDGDPTVCSQLDPCSLENAVEHASVDNGDEIVVGSGTYDLGTGSISVTRAIDLHGAAGGPRPKITTASTTAFDAAVSVSAAGATVRDLELANTATGSGNAIGLFVSTGGNTIVERVSVTTAGGPACEVITGTLRDSTCRNTGFGAGITIPVGGFPGGSTTLVLRNVTTVSEGTSAFSDGIALFVSGTNYTYTIDAKNVIAIGGTRDVYASESGAGTNAIINFEHSNYDSVDPAGTGAVTAPGTGTGNQVAAPSFVNQTAGNYHQNYGSPTVDAGAVGVSALGTADFEGDARVLDGDCDDDSDPDIGADELAVACADNDDFDEAQMLSGFTASVPGTTRGATRQPGAGEPDHCVTATGPGQDCFAWIGDHSVWYSWTAPAPGPVTIDTCTAAIDSILAVYTGSALNALTRVVDDNNACLPGSFGSRVTFTAVAGTTYRIAVGDAGGARENDFTLNLVGPPSATLSATGHDFGSRPISAGPASNATFTLSNQGGSGLAIGSVSLAGADASEFAKDDLDCTGTGTGHANSLLNPGESCTVAVSFDPATVGAKVAQLDIATDGGNVSVALAGIGAEDPVTPVPDDDDQIPGPDADLIAPETTISKGPKAKMKRKRATFEFVSSEAGSRFECQLDGKGFAPCNSPHSVRVKKGKHVLAVRAIDAAGNADPTPASRSWKVKRKKPRAS